MDATMGHEQAPQSDEPGAAPQARAAAQAKLSRGVADVRRLEPRCHRGVPCERRQGRAVRGPAAPAPPPQGREDRHRARQPARLPAASATRSPSSARRPAPTRSRLVPQPRRPPGYGRRGGHGDDSRARPRGRGRGARADLGGAEAREPELRRLRAEDGAHDSGRDPRARRFLSDHSGRLRVVDSGTVGLSTLHMPRRKRIALIAHDNRKPDLLAWARYNRTTLGHHQLFATGTTGALLASELGLDVTRSPQRAARRRSTGGSGYRRGADRLRDLLLVPGSSCTRTTST